MKTTITHCGLFVYAGLYLVKLSLYISVSNDVGTEAIAASCQLPAPLSRSATSYMLKHNLRFEF